MNTLPEYKFLDFFKEISKIPRGSGNTDGIADYLTDFAKARGLKYVRDKANNVIIRKPASKGYENHPAVILQGHTDMVLQSADGNISSLEKNGVNILCDGDFLRADGTTLGADNGIAVAYALAVLDSNDIMHPAFEGVFTSDEEIGLLGATALDGNNIRGRMMINIDSDAEGIFTVGCAGGRRVDISLPITREKSDGTKYTLTLDGLKGGHSGIEIDKGRTNATKRLIEYLAALGNIRLISLSGGVADNAIPSSASAEFTSALDMSDISGIIENLKSKKSPEEEKENITLIKAGTAENVLTESSTKEVISLIFELPSGVIKMSEDIKGQVETSLNLGITRLEEDAAKLSFSLRSSKGAQKEKLADEIKAIAKKYGAHSSEHGNYPAWEYRKDSPLRDTMCRIYREMYKRDAEVVTIHAGLECGIFSDKLEGLDCVSIGPNAYDIHTPSERLSISSAVRVWEYLIKVLENI